MAAVSARKAWAVTSHLMFFTATLCPKYSPCRTSGRARESQLSPTPGLLHSRLSPLCHEMGRGSGSAIWGTSSPTLSPTSELALPNAFSQCEVLQVQQPASWAWAQGQVSRATSGALSLKCRPQPPPSSPTFGQLLLS